MSLSQSLDLSKNILKRLPADVRKLKALKRLDIRENNLSEIDAAVVNAHETQAGYTALMYASEHGHDACVQALIEAGARKDLETKKGSTALSLARSNGHSALCALLENSGID